jgi:hypothetical protein
VLVIEDHFPKLPVELDDAKTTPGSLITEASDKTAMIAEEERPLDKQRSLRYGLLKRARIYTWPDLGRTGRQMRV